MKKEFIISYAPGWCNIAAASIDKNMKEMYEFAMNRHKIEGKTILPYNNQFWGSVMANNSKEAFDIFYERFKKEWP